MIRLWYTEVVLPSTRTVDGFVPDESVVPFGDMATVVVSGGVVVIVRCGLSGLQPKILNLKAGDEPCHSMG